MCIRSWPERKVNQLLSVASAFWHEPSEECTLRLHILEWFAAVEKGVIISHLYFFK